MRLLDEWMRFLYLFRISSCKVGILLAGVASPSTGKHTIFGRACRGMEIVKRLGSVQTDKNDRPIHEVKILRAIVKD
ncbi:unnamed protein product [Urochloa humidicola]